MAEEKKEPEQPKFDPTYTGMEPKDKGSLIERGLEWYKGVLQPVSDWLYDVFNPGASIPEPPKPKSIPDAVINYQNLPYKGKKTGK